MKTRIPVLIFFFLLLTTGSNAAQNNDQRPLELADVLGWQSIRSEVVSNDGEWFAYRLVPGEGDAQVVVRQTRGEKSFIFPAGESSDGKVAISDDSRWLAFFVYPTREEARKLKQGRKSVRSTVALVDLATGEKTDFEEVEDFSFSGRNPKWLALHRFGAEERNSGAGNGNGNGDEQGKARGRDLIVRELESGREWNIGNVAEYEFDKYGRWLAWTIDAEDQVGNGVSVRVLDSGVVRSLDSDRVRYERLAWNEDGDGLAVLKGVEDEDYEELLYSLLGFKSLDSADPEVAEYDPKNDQDFPQGMTISPDRDPLWTDDLDGILFGIRELKPKEKKRGSNGGNKSASGDDSGEEEIPGLVIWHWQDKRLQSKQQVQERRDKNFSYLSIFRVGEKKFIRLADDEVRDVEPSPKHRWAIGMDDRQYERQGNLDGRRFQDIYTFDLTTGERRLALEKCRWFFGPSPEGSHLLFYSDGHYSTYEMATGLTYRITEGVSTSFIDEEDDHNVVDPPVRPVGWVKDGISVLLYDNWDVWNVPVHGGRASNLTANGKSDQIRYQRRFRLDPEEKGIDLSKPVYFGAYGEWTKKSGIARLEPGQGQTQMLLWDDGSYSDLLKARDADLYLFTRSTFEEFPNFRVAGAGLADSSQITDANPQQKDFSWSSGSRLIDYQSDKGDRLQAALYLPAHYEEGKSYPTVVYIYEDLSQNLNRYSAPSAYGFNKSVYTSNGYAVLMPDITYRVDDPGMSAVWCVLPALKAAIETGIVDAEKVGLQGHSWGGYQTSFLITQTDAFKAAVAGAPLTNLISMYSSVYWNTGSPNQPIFESSQGRFRGGYWDQTEAYVRNSPVYFSSQVNTPLMILHNDKDGAVDWNQGIEYFNTLRRLDKPVVMLQYKGENHGLAKMENRKDYTVRMREFFDHHLRGQPAPDWLQEGVAHLEIQKHLEGRLEIIHPAVTKFSESLNEPPEGFKSLFNGTDLTGWHGMGHFDPRQLEETSGQERRAKRAADMEELLKHWHVENGAIVNDGQGPYLTTDQEYGDIELLIEYKTVAKADSGIYLRTTPQIQIWDYTEEGGKWDRGADKGSGGLFNNSPGSPGKEPLVLADKPFGEWNQLRIIQVGERTTVYLNGQLVVDFARMENYWDRSKPLRRNGYIQLQTHGGEIRWRNIFLRQIGSDEANQYLAERTASGYTSIFDGRTLEGWAGPLDNYQVVDGTVQCKTGKGGTIYFNRELRDFSVRLEFKLPPGGNNGLAIRYPGTGNTAYEGMTELQVLDNTAERYAEIDDRQFHGSVYGMIAAEKGYLRPVGEWNYQEVTVLGSRIQVELNGTVILDADVATVTEFMGDRPHPGKDRTSGFFGFAGHSDPVQYRRIYIREIE